MRGAMMVSAYSSTSGRESVVELRRHEENRLVGGVDLLHVGGAGMLGGSLLSTAAMAFCTSCAAPSILRSSTNCRVMLVLPRPLSEVMESRPGTVENCRSSGVATEAAMVSGLAPGSEACTWSVGKSMFGRSLTGSER